MFGGVTGAGGDRGTGGRCAKAAYTVAMGFGPLAYCWRTRVLRVVPRVLGVVPQVLGVVPRVLGVVPRVLGVVPRVLRVVPGY